MRSVDDENVLDITPLKHASQHYYIVKKSADTGEYEDVQRLKMRKFIGSTELITKDFRLKKGMLTQHMSYCDVFDGYVDREPTPSAVPRTLFEEVLKVD